MTDTDRLRLARLVQFRELITLIFRDPTPWGESLPVQVLADFLEAEGAHDVADAVRGRFCGEDGREWQLTGTFLDKWRNTWGAEGKELRAIFEPMPRNTSGDYKRKERPKD